MKPYPYILFLLVCTYSCQKNLPVAANLNPNLRPLHSDSTILADSAQAPPFPFLSFNNSAPGCPVLPMYGDTLIYPQPTAGDDIVLPVNSPGPGQYFSWPAGMVLDQKTGAIDLTASQSGMRYAVGFVPAGTKDTCMQTVIIAGAAYMDSLHVMSNNDTLAMPYFNASGQLWNVCSTPGACSFDYDGNAAKKGIIIDPATGAIQLSGTVNGKGNMKGVFGDVPKNGATAVVKIAYQLNDGSNNAPQQIMVKIEYYDNIASVPPGQLNIMAAQTFNAENDRLINTTRNPRPPVIIIVRRN
jgi:hypothetical protein